MVYYLQVVYVAHEVDPTSMIADVDAIRTVYPIHVDFVDACDILTEYCTIRVIQASLYEDGILRINGSGPKALAIIKSYLEKQQQQPPKPDPSSHSQE